MAPLRPGSAWFALLLLLAAAVPALAEKKEKVSSPSFAIFLPYG